MTSWASPADGPGVGAAPGMKLGDRYELTGPIAAGGMAQVWRATDLVLDRTVAVKILHAHLATDEAFVARFRREAVAAARLSHPSIVSVYDTISTPAVKAIVMELISGQTLREVLDEAGALPAREVIRLGAQISAALDEAHRAGIVHRDIKPANIIIADDDRVMVTDFGIAKAGTDADITTTGTLLGTAKYLSPEQVTGEPLDPRSDLYALGVVLYESLAGTVPFKANTDAATALARLHQDPPPLRRFRPNVPLALEAVVERLMARDANDRYARASAARLALLDVDPDGPSAPDPAVTGLGPGEPGPTPNPGPGIGTGPRPHADQNLADPYVQPGGGGRPPTGPGGQPANPTTRSHRPVGVPPLTPSVTGQTPVPSPLPNPGPRPGVWTGPGTGPASHPGAGPSAGSNRPRPPDPPPNLIEGPPLAPPSEVVGIVPPGTARPVSFSDESVRRSGRSRVAAVVTAILIAVAIIVAIALVTDIGQSQRSAAGASIASVTSFDPQTADPDREEKEELVPLTVDDDLSTAWTTETYRNRELGSKTGVGLILILDRRGPVNQIAFDTNTEDWAAEIYVGDEFGDDETTWGPPTSIVEAGSLRAVRDLNGAEGSQILIWIRNTGVSDGLLRFELAEVEIS